MIRFFPRRRLAIAPLCFALLVFGATRASADSITYYLTTQNGVLPGSGPYGEVTVNQTGNTATFTYQALTNSGYTYLFGDGASAAANINGAFTVNGGAGGIVGVNPYPGFTPATYTIGSGNADGFGSFNLNIDASDGFKNSSSTLTFTITKTSGTWSSAANVLTPNAQGEILAAHIFVCATPCTFASGAVVTGYAAGADDAPPVVPEPATLTLLGTGLAFVGRAYRRRRKA